MMGINKNIYSQILDFTKTKNVLLIAVSKFQEIEKIKELHYFGQLHFGENYVQELVLKAPQLPTAILWHFIGNLQRNKVKDLIPFVYCIHSVDSLPLLNEIQKRAMAINKKIKILFQLKIAHEESKFGLSQQELIFILDYYKQHIKEYSHIEIVGLMGITSLVADKEVIKKEFKVLKKMFDRSKKEYFYDQNSYHQISMGMSSDYEIAVEEGATMIRIGSAIFGERSLK